MKQIIVMIAMVLLGIAIAGFIGDFRANAEKLSGETNKKVTQLSID